LLLLHLGGATAAAQQAQHGERVDAEDPARDQRDRDGADADASSANEAATTTTATFAAAVFDVVRLIIAFPSHRALLAGLCWRICRRSQDGTWRRAARGNRASAPARRRVRFLAM
jgi:uncharacterized MAPEG superfamily protein